MVDFLGNELNIGDTVVYIVHSDTSSHFNKGTVERLTQYTATILGENGRTARKNLEKVLKVG